MAKNNIKRNSLLVLSFGNAILLALGICLVIWADKVTSFISICFGALFLLYALYIIIAYLRVEKEKRSIAQIVVAIALCIAGAFLIIRHQFLAELISFIIGIFIVIVGIFKLQDVLTRRAAIHKITLPLLLAFGEILFGVLCIAGKFVLPDIFLQIIGVMLILSSISGFITGFIVNQAEKSAPKSTADKAIEAEIVKKD